MTAQEQQLLEELTARVNQTQLAEKDAEAEQYLAQAFGRNPDAIYILAQTVLVQQYALDQARQQLDQAHQAAPPQKHTSFLGNLLGRNEAAPPPPAPAAYTPVNATGGYTPAYAPPQGYAAQPQGYAQPQQGGFLRSALQTATGVAAGALAFQGVESLLGGFGHHAGYGDNFGGDRPEEIVNNYYGDRDRGGTGDLSGDASSRDFADSNSDNAGDDFADSTSDDSSLGNDDSF